jgi:putative ATP-dependent endonuclease of OLD family
VRIARVEIEKFLCFRHLSIPVDRSLQLLAGPNNAGKSSFIRLLEAFFSDPDGEALSKLLPRNAYYAETGPRTLSWVRLWFSELSEDEVAEVGEAYRRDGMTWVSLRCSRAGTVSFEASKVGRQEEARRLYEYVLHRYQFVKIPSVCVGGSGDAASQTSLARLLDTLEAILIRRTPGSRTALQRRFGEKAKELEIIVKEVLDESAASIDKDLPFQGGAVTFTLPDARFALRGMLEATIIESGEQARVAVAERGTGFQSALVLGMLRYVANMELQADGEVLFAIEEPEAFLHPQTQRAMTQVLKRIADGAQVIVTTHSPVVVDTFKLTQIARLPLAPDGTDFEWSPPDLDDAQEGRLSRYCTAANSELVFANAAILVEGEGDYLAIEHLLGRICRDAGGHYARGITVIEAGGIGRIKRLVELAEHFGVRSFVLVDRDGLRAPNGRVLLDILDGRSEAPAREVKDALRALADAPCSDYKKALATQAKLNLLLAAYDAFVMASDLEGMLIDAFGVERITAILGPQGERVLDQQFVETELNGQPDARDRLGRHLGSKSWQADVKPSGKLEPHLPRIVLEGALSESNSIPTEIQRLQSWLKVITDGASASAV